MNHPHNSQHLHPSYPHLPPYALSAQHSSAAPEFTSPPNYLIPSNWLTPFASWAAVPATPPMCNHAIAHHVTGNFNVNSVMLISSPPHPPWTGASTPSQSAGPIGMDARSTMGSKCPQHGCTQTQVAIARCLCWGCTWAMWMYWLPTCS